MAAYGSPEYELTWKHWDMSLGPPILQRRASGRRTSGKGFTGWPTPQTHDVTERGNTMADHHHYPHDLSNAAQMVGWPTPNAISESRGGLQSNPEMALKRRAQGHMLNLDDAATLAGWATPTSRDHKDAASDLTNTPVNGLLGRQALISTASTEKRGALASEFSSWLMGFPLEWQMAAPTKRKK